MQGIQLLLIPFVWVLQLFYNLFNSYGIALILFALLVKIIMFPLSLKGKRSMIQMNLLNGRMQKLQKMYANNQEKYQMELQKLYEKEGVNPMGGCLWSLLPILVIFPLYAIIRQPLTYMMNMTPEVIQQVAVALNWDTVAVQNGWITQELVDRAVKAAADAGTTFVTSFTNAGYYQLYLSSLVKGSLPTVQAIAGAEGAFALNFGFLGIDLAQVPQLKFWAAGLSWEAVGLFLLPVISASTGLIYSLVSMRTNAVNQQSAQAANSSSKMMLIISPLMSLWIGFSMPAALSVYWIANSLLSMVSEFIAGKMLKKDYEKARMEQERRALEEKEEEKRLKEEARQERARRLEEQKKNSKGKKKPQKKEEPVPGINKDASREGLRAYARGRAYDPFRFSPDGPTPYQDAAFTVDDAAVEKALEEKEEAREKAEFAEKYQLTEEDMKELEQELPDGQEPSGEPEQPEEPIPDGEDAAEEDDREQ